MHVVEADNTTELVAISDVLSFSWTVIDPRPTNTTIVGLDTTKETNVEFELTANKPGCSYHRERGEGRHPNCQQCYASFNIKRSSSRGAVNK